jgi:hypothetical protein
MRRNFCHGVDCRDCNLIRGCETGEITKISDDQYEKRCVALQQRCITYFLFISFLLMENNLTSNAIPHHHHRCSDESHYCCEKDGLLSKTTNNSKFVMLLITILPNLQVP